VSALSATLLRALTPQPTESTERYANRLDAHLAKMASDADRHEFLEREEAKWRRLYQEWAADVDAGRKLIGPGHPTAFDFTITLADIGTRKARYERVAA
jgi:hypothetical protein